MDEEGMDHMEMERRLRTLEREAAATTTLLARNSEILDDIRAYMNKPTNWAEWVTAGVAAASALTGVMWAVFVLPLEAKVDAVSERSIENRAHVRDMGDYLEETRSNLDNYIRNHESK